MPNPLHALAVWRERRGLSVDELATRAGVSVATVKRLERGGMPSYASGWALADALEVEPRWLERAQTECLERGARATRVVRDLGLSDRAKRMRAARSQKPRTVA